MLKYVQLRHNKFHTRSDCSSIYQGCSVSLASLRDGGSSGKDGTKGYAEGEGKLHIGSVKD